MIPSIRRPPGQGTGCPTSGSHPGASDHPVSCSPKPERSEGRGVGGGGPPRSGADSPPQVRSGAPITCMSMPVHPPPSDGSAPDRSSSSRTAWRARSLARDGFTRSRGFSPSAASLDHASAATLSPGSDFPSPGPARWSSSSPRGGDRSSPARTHRRAEVHAVCLAAPRLAQRQVVALVHVRSIRSVRDP